MLIATHAGAGVLAKDSAGAAPKGAAGRPRTDGIRDDVAARIDEYLTRSVPFGFSGVVLLTRGGKVMALTYAGAPGNPVAKKVR